MTAIISIVKNELYSKTNIVTICIVDAVASQSLFEMYSIMERYYKIIPIVLKSLGLWPYQQSYFTQVHQILYASILLSFILVQLLVFIKRQCNTELFFMVLSFVCPNIFATIKYFTFITKANSLKQLLEQIQNDCNLLKDKLEINILEKYNRNARLVILSLLGFCYTILFIFSTLQYLPFILHKMLPFNKSRSLQLVTSTEYLIIPDKYIYVRMLHEFLAFYVGLITICATGLTALIYCVHMCVLLEIASYRIKNVIQMNTLVIPSPKREQVVHQRIVNAIIIHQRAIEYHKLFMFVLLIPFGILCIVGMGSIVFALFLFTQQVASNNMGMASVAFGLLQFFIIYLIIGCYCGQRIIDNGINFFEDTYNGLWYVAPLSTQKLLLFVMQRGRAYFSLTFYGVIAASFDGLVTLLKLAISYFMVLNSVQK
ncbi:uncharacterized protein LOC113003319 isoform X2 [Solenopsis invicta]|uniref:uncharacterized protein LOC113003319 isoform X2 n=1 Tax=Solenopsis invicta TaxID=13686 RepID=UPI00193DBD3E|nr:uncharacterized protein LOC113003319 isoform X2 [Solenopsis invicta]